MLEVNMLTNDTQMAWVGKRQDLRILDPPRPRRGGGVYLLLNRGLFVFLRVPVPVRFLESWV